jgi:hypothetical protein
MEQNLHDLPERQRHKLSGNIQPGLKAETREKLERKLSAHRAFC